MSFGGDVDREQARRRSDGKFFVQHRRGEYPGDPDREVHTYGGPQGIGYVKISHRVLGGVPQTMAVNVGPERWRSHAWQDLPGAE